MPKMTLTESAILKNVTAVNRQEILAGLGTSPDAPNFDSPKFRFVKRLYARGAIIWVAYTPKYGAGWAIPETLGIFKS